MTDPRYDPSFQRGYDGPPPELVMRPTSSASPPDPVEPAAAAADGPTGAGDRPTETGSGHAGAASAAEPETEPGSRRRLNPYSLVLLVGGLLVTAIGAWMLQQLSAGLVQVEGTDSAALVRQALIQQLAPALVVGGILVLVAWLVLGAVSAHEKTRS